MRKIMSTALICASLMTSFTACDLLGKTQTPADVAVTSVTIDKSTLTLEEAGTSVLTAQVLPSDATNKLITWSSSNTAAVTVSGGTITAVAEGSAVITAASSADSTKKAECTVTVTAMRRSSVFNPAGTADISSTFDAWSSGTTITADYTGDATYTPVIKLDSGTGWGTCIGFTKIVPGTLVGYNYLEFKVNASLYSAASVKVKVPEIEQSYDLSTGTALEGGWYQMRIPLSAFSAVTASANQFAIFGKGTGTLLITDVNLAGTNSTVVKTALAAAVTAAQTKADAAVAGTANGNYPQEAITAFETAVAAAETVNSDADATQDEVNAALAALTAADTAFELTKVVGLPDAFAANPTDADAFYIFNSSGTYTAVSGVENANWNPNWNQAGSMTDAVVTVGETSRTLKLLDLKDYQGVNLCSTDGGAANGTLNFTGANTIHVSYWTLDGTALNVYPINASGEQIIANTTITTGQWVDASYKIPSAFDVTTLRQLKFEGLGLYYLDNIYFSNDPVEPDTTPNPSGTAVTGVNGTIYVSNMTEGNLTVTIKPAAGKTLNSSQAFIAVGTTDGTVHGGNAAVVPLVRDASTGFWSATTTQTTANWVAGNTIGICLEVVYSDGAVFLPNASLGDRTTWATFVYGQ